MTATETTKRCPTCGETKPVEEFGWRSNRRWRRGQCKPCERGYTARWHRSNPERARANQRKKDLRIKYGITPDEYDRLLATQDGACAICRGQQVDHRRYFDVDHDHATGQVRGLLCSLCNVLLGAARDRVDLLAAAGDYLAGRR